MAATTISPNNIKIAFKGKPMAKSKSTAPVPGAIAEGRPDRDFEAEDAFRTLRRSEEIAGDVDMMKRVGTHTKKEVSGIDAVMAKLKKQGLVSDKAAAIANRRTAARK